MEEKVSINIGNAEAGGENIKKKFIEITEEGKAKIKNYVLEMDKKSCCKKFGCVLFKFIVVGALLNAMILLTVRVTQMYSYDRQADLRLSVDLLRYEIHSLQNEIRDDKRDISAKLDQVLQSLSSLETKPKEKNSDHDTENFNLWLPWILTDYNLLSDRSSDLFGNEYKWDVDGSEQKDKNLSAELEEVKLLSQADDDLFGDSTTKKKE